MGLEYDKDTGYSNDFVIHQRYHGYLWRVNWMEDNTFYAWHINEENELKSKVKAFGNITVNEIEQVYEKGQKALIPLTKKNINTHPLSLLLRLTNNLNNDEKNIG